jgi:transcriptional regulator with XRE-family HTH domain
MRTAEMVAEFLKHRYESRQLVQAGIVEVTGLTRGMVSLIINGRRVFPMYYIDEIAAFFGMGVPEFLVHVEAELKRAGRWREDVTPTVEETVRLRLLRLRAGQIGEDE